MTFITDQDSNLFAKKEITEALEKAKIKYTFNYNPERYISRSLTQTKLKKFLECPKCYFLGSKAESENNSEILLSNAIHYLADYLIRNQSKFPNSHSVLDFINFSEGNFLEHLKTDEENANYDLLKYLAELEDYEIKEKILKGVLIVYGTAKRLGFEEIRKRDSISLNLQNEKNRAWLTFYTKPDYTGRHKTLHPKSGRKYDNFLIDYKLNFSQDTKSNSLQLAFYYLTHILSNRKINNYLILDLTSGNLYNLQKINLDSFFNLINKFLILKNINYRSKNSKHSCTLSENIFQENFLDNLDLENFGTSFGSQTYNELLLELKKLEASIEIADLGQIVKPEELEKVLNLYPIKIDSNSKDW